MKCRPINETAYSCFIVFGILPLFKHMLKISIVLIILRETSTYIYQPKLDLACRFFSWYQLDSKWKINISRVFNLVISCLLISTVWIYANPTNVLKNATWWTNKYIVPTVKKWWKEKYICSSSLNVVERRLILRVFCDSGIHKQRDATRCRAYLLHTSCLVRFFVTFIVVLWIYVGWRYSSTFRPRIYATTNLKS